MSSRTGAASIEETIIFILFNISLIVIGIILWYFVWIKQYGGEIPNPQLSNETNISFFSTKNFGMLISQLYQHIKKFDKNYFIRSVGVEGYIYLTFQRKLITLMLSYILLALMFSGIGLLLKEREYQQDWVNTVQNFFMSNKYFNDYTTIMHVIAIGVYTFLHFRCFAQIGREASYLYFERFDKMSREKNADWLACRTLHISGIGPNERNSKFIFSHIIIADSLIHKLNLFLEKKQGTGRVIDLNFIPDYKKILHLEKNKTQMLDLRNLIEPSKAKCCHQLLLPRIYRSEATLQRELDNNEAEMQHLTEEPVISSGHAFVCFDSLISTYKILSSFKENTFKKITLKLKAMRESMQNKRTPRELTQGNNTTFGKFQEELALESEDLKNVKVDILVDQMVEPFDIIWLNVGGDRGLYICRRILCNLFILVILFFLTSTTSFFSSNRFKEYFANKEYNGFHYGLLLITYTPPLVLLTLNISIIFIIGILCRFETHYTHTNYHYAIFNKSFIYMLFNLFIIPAFTLSLDAIYSVFKNEIGIQELISKAYLANSGYFFVALILQCGSFSSFYYILRINELIPNSFSPFITFYQRHFTNTGNQWHRKEASPFYYGYFYSCFLIFYTICLVFTSTVPLTSVAGLYLFLFRHIVDSISLLMVHGVEMDSNGRLINLALNRSSIPVFIYHCCMISLFLVKEKYTACIFIGIILIISIIYSYSVHSNYIFDFYALHEKLAQYDHLDAELSENEINKWRNKYRHPLVIPIHVDNHETISNNKDWNSNQIYSNADFKNSESYLIDRNDVN